MNSKASGDTVIPTSTALPLRNSIEHVLAAEPHLFSATCSLGLDPRASFAAGSKQMRSAAESPRPARNPASSNRSISAVGSPDR
ncbi:hypothetical protein [Nocardia asteroides]|uniref:hypothetical protein n=1 Tax=Nocardia asteroides TaxID=1824 RepID=UPI00138E3976|nr:hypothetical protein [Nocardia asteroides]UGT48230.1 hypothetical protein LT345_27760 [Nocardia asteroides]